MAPRSCRRRHGRGRRAAAGPCVRRRLRRRCRSRPRDGGRRRRRRSRVRRIAAAGVRADGCHDGRAGPPGGDAGTLRRLPGGDPGRCRCRRCGAAQAGPAPGLHPLAAGGGFHRRHRRRHRRPAGPERARSRQAGRRECRGERSAGHRALRRGPALGGTGAAGAGTDADSVAPAVAPRAAGEPARCRGHHCRRRDRRPAGDPAGDAALLAAGPRNSGSRLAAGPGRAGRDRGLPRGTGEPALRAGRRRDGGHRSSRPRPRAVRAGAGQHRLRTVRWAACDGSDRPDCRERPRRRPHPGGGADPRAGAGWHRLHSLRVGRQDSAGRAGCGPDRHGLSDGRTTPRARRPAVHPGRCPGVLGDRCGHRAVRPHQGRRGGPGGRRRPRGRANGQDRSRGAGAAGVRRPRQRRRTRPTRLARPDVPRRRTAVLRCVRPVPVRADGHRRHPGRHPAAERDGPARRDRRKGARGVRRAVRRSWDHGAHQGRQR